MITCLLLLAFWKYRVGQKNSLRFNVYISTVINLEHKLDWRFEHHFTLYSFKQVKGVDDFLNHYKRLDQLEVSTKTPLRYIFIIRMYTAGLCLLSEIEKKKKRDLKNKFSPERVLLSFTSLGSKFQEPSSRLTSNIAKQVRSSRTRVSFNPALATTGQGLVKAGRKIFILLHYHYYPYYYYLD